MSFIVRWAGAKGLDAGGKPEGPTWLEHAPEDPRGRHVWTQDKTKARRFETFQGANDIAERWCYDLGGRFRREAVVEVLQ